MAEILNPDTISGGDSPSVNRLKHFKFWCQKIIPLVYDDALSYYEVLCKIRDYINQIIDVVNNHEERIEALEAAVDALEQLVQALTERVTSLEGRVTEIEALITQLQNAINAINVKITSIEGVINNLNTLITNINTRIDGLDSEITAIKNPRILNRYEFVDIVSPTISGEWTFSGDDNWCRINADGSVDFSVAVGYEADMSDPSPTTVEVQINMTNLGKPIWNKYYSYIVYATSIAGASDRKVVGKAYLNPSTGKFRFTIEDDMDCNFTGRFYLNNVA